MSATIWHDLECGAYEADLPLWEELADQTGGPVLDLGCGTGRVALHLARRGHTVLGLDRDAELLGALARRGAELPLEAERGDAGGFALGAHFGLVLAPMQLLQLLEPQARAGCLASVAAHLRAGGLAALAIVDELPPVAMGTTPLPDAREVDGWVYSSLPLESRLVDGQILVRRLRQTVSPQGELDEEVDEARLHVLDAASIEREARAAGLRPTARREIAATQDHVGSTAILFEPGAS